MPTILFAQKQMALYGLKQLPQIVEYNPAIQPLGRVNVGIPSISSASLGFGVSDFAFNDLFKTDAAGKKVFDTRHFVNNLKDENQFFGRIDLELFHIGLAQGRNYIHFGIKDKFDYRFFFPRETAVLIREVYEEEYEGRRVTVSDMKLNAKHYREFVLGFSRMVNEKLTLGGRLKYLNGIGNIQTNRFSFDVDNETSQTATVGGQLAFDIQSSGVEGYTTGDQLKHLTEFKNGGFAIDLGASYKYNERISFGFAAQDLFGKITWKQGNQNYRNRSIEVEINPADADEIFGSGGIDDFLDSLQTSINQKETTEKFSTTIESRFNFHAGYQLSPKTEVMLLGQHIAYEKDPLTTVKLGFSGRIGKIFNGVLTYAVYDKTQAPLNLGVGFTVNLSYLQLHVITENALIALSSGDQRLNPTFRFGANLTFGMANQ